MIVRPAVRQDAAGIYDLEQESFSVPWSRESINHELEHTELTRYYVLVRDDGYIAGYAGLWRVTDEGQITNIALRKDARGRGYGELLVRVMMKKGAWIFFWKYAFPICRLWDYIVNWGLKFFPCGRDIILSPWKMPMSWDVRKKSINGL